MKNILFIILLILFSNSTFAFDPSLTTSPQYNLSILSPSLNFTTSEMRVMSLNSWQSANIDYPEVTRALQDYHATQTYTQTSEQYINNPSLYFSERINALQNLIDAIPENTFDSTLQTLLSQAKNKLIYLLSLPSPKDPYCLNAEALTLKGLIIKSLEMRESYWFEIRDPLHRAGQETKIHLERWMVSDIPNIFIFLETVENDPLLNKYAPLDKSYKYYQTPEEREPHLLHFVEGLAILGGKPFDSVKSYAIPNKKNSAIYVVGLDGEFYVNQDSDSQIHHSSEFAGSTILGAGEMIAADGKILKISNQSGHYRPKLGDFLNTLEVLKSKLGDLHGIEANFYFYQVNDVRSVASYDAQEFLDTSGHAPALGVSNGWTPLHVAVWNNHLELAPKTINSKDVNQKEDLGNTPLHIAIIQGHKEWAELLVEAGADVSIRNLEGNIPLHIAARNGDIELIKMLMTYQTGLDVRNKEGATPLHLAFSSGNIEAIKQIVKSEEGIKVKDRTGNTIFHYAVLKGNAALLQQMFKETNINDWNQINNKGASPLHYAAAWGDNETLSALLNLGLDVYAKDNEGNTILHYAANSGNIETCQLLIDAMDPQLLNSSNLRGATPFHCAVGKVPNNILKKFLEFGLPIDIQDIDGNTPLFYAMASPMSFAHANLLLLLENGADSHLRNLTGFAPIHVAGLTNSVKKVQRLLTYSDDVDFTDHEGNTVFHLGVIEKDKSLVEFLLPYLSVAALTKKNHAGQSPLDLAIGSEWESMRLFIEAKLQK